MSLLSVVHVDLVKLFELSILLILNNSSFLLQLVHTNI